MRLLPAPPNSGLAFVRTDLNPPVRIEVQATNVTDTLLATTLTTADTHIATVEHLLCALCICGVDNAVIEVNNSEVPIMDGSARPFVLLIHDTGLVEQEAAKQFYRVRKTMSVHLEDEPHRQARYEPYHTACWEVSINFSDPAIRRTPQNCQHELTDHQLSVAGIAGARTFGFVRELDYMRARQRALGGTLDNAIVINGTGILNEGGLRQDDEFAAHKLLDVMGDCYIDGKLVLGRYVASMPGHRLNNELMCALLASPDNFEIVSADELQDSSSVPDFGPLVAQAHNPVPVTKKSYDLWSALSCIKAFRAAS